MKNFDITIYGHLSYDNIYEGFNYKSSVGCMGNVWNQLKLINPNIRLRLEPTDIGESLIMVDKDHSKRTSISRLSLKTRTPVIYDSQVSHIMYLNELTNTSFIQGLNGFVVADTCNGKPIQIDASALSNIDLLLISDEDLNVDVMKLASLVRYGVLVHYPTGSILHTKIGFKQFGAELVKNINVLGAGDKFAAYILAGLLDSADDLPKVIQQAHNSLTDYFKNEKI